MTNTEEIRFLKPQVVTSHVQLWLYSAFCGSGPATQWKPPSFLKYNPSFLLLCCEVPKTFLASLMAKWLSSKEEILPLKHSSPKGAHSASGWVPTRGQECGARWEGCEEGGRHLGMVLHWVFLTVGTKWPDTSFFCCCPFPVRLYSTLLDMKQNKPYLSFYFLLGTIKKST